MEYKQFAEMFDTDDVRFRGKNIIVVPVINGEPFETACLTRTMSLNDRLIASDLTMNAMAKDVETGELIDPCKGQKDIKK
jgi:tRNA nucleotidyltransferase/poly(A) polymerase